MEVFFVYSLVPLFFVLLFGIIVFVLLPEKQGSKIEQPHTEATQQEGKMVYISLGVLFALLFVFAFLMERRSA
ncbi:MAG: hypothetical protein M3Z24_12175 [Chloroflexota bacterium]|nr:hypothetical protein [Chloroflexota bacterium]